MKAHYGRCGPIVFAALLGTASVLVGCPDGSAVGGESPDSGTTPGLDMDAEIYGGGVSDAVNDGVEGEVDSAGPVDDFSVDEEATNPYGTPCDDDFECQAGVCITLADGTRICTESCNTGACTQAGDECVSGVCVPVATMTCVPCQTDADCADPNGLPGVVCGEPGGQGSFCAPPCDDDVQCPEGTICGDVATDSGTVKGCTPAAGGECLCSPLALELANAAACENAGELGICAGTRVCNDDGTLTPCDAPAAAPETCNGLDDDCDADIDEDFQYEGAAIGGVCDGIGSCPEGTVECTTDASAATCSTNPDGSTPEDGAEICDGNDNDCNGVVDDGLQWEGQALGEACEGAGECGPGVVECALGDAPVTTCSTNPDGSASEATAEICDGLDNDCNGVVDDGFQWQGLQPGQACDGTGACGEGTVVCAAGGQSATCSTNPDGPAPQSTPEICDGLDNNCSGTVDEGFSYEGAPLGEPCVGVGECGAGFVECRADGAAATCSTNPDGSQGPNAGEACDGLDNNCNGEIDEGLTWQGSPLGQACTGTGECGEGTVECSVDGTDVPTCSSNADGTASEAVGELCDGLDNNCDGIVDESFLWDDLALGAACDGTGECGGGVVECVADGTAATCSTNPDGTASEASPETCDTLDEDCNGTVDDVEGADAPDFPCKVAGQCASGGVVGSCEAGEWSCDYSAVPDYQDTETLCDALDNDCDGSNDEICGPPQAYSTLGVSCSAATLSDGHFVAAAIGVGMHVSSFANNDGTNHGVALGVLPRAVIVKFAQ